MEVWKKINNFNNYSISNAGKIRNDKTNRILKPYIKPSGYKKGNKKNWIFKLKI